MRTTDLMRARLAIVASHPIQYHAPWYRALAARVNLHVFFAHEIRPADHAAAGFAVPFAWDVQLLDGYTSEFLRNVAAAPGVDRFRGCNTPDLAQLLTADRFDAVLVTGWNLQSYWQAIFAARRTGLSVLVRGDSQLLTPRSVFSRGAKRLAYPYLLRAFDAFLPVGRRSEEYYRHYGVPADRLYRSPHSVDNAFFARAAETARARTGGARMPLGFGEQDIVFLFAGKLVDLKRPLDFVVALDRARRRCPRIGGVIAGDGPLRGAVEACCAAHDARCTILGFVNQRQIGAIYAAADVLVLPSASETWGLVVNEAMACGVPAIVSDRAGCAADLIVDGVTGFSYRAGDIDALAERMIQLAEDAARRRQIAAQAAAHVQQFSPDATAAGIVAAIEGLRARRATAA